MEEERYYYKKILRDCVMPEGLFEIKDRESNFYLIFENKKDVDTITNLLNQQDKRIKELEEENKQLKERISKQFDKIQILTKTCDVEKEFGDKMFKENQQFKQQLSDEEKAHDLCIDHFNEECEKLRKQIKFESEARERFKQSQSKRRLKCLRQ